jgi:hypothetical protein
MNSSTLFSTFAAVPLVNIGESNPRPNGSPKKIVLTPGTSITNCQCMEPSWHEQEATGN